MPPPFEIVCDWMGNGNITEYMDKHPQSGCADLVSGFVSGTTTPSRTSNITAAGHGKWSLLPPFIRNRTRRLEGCKSLCPSFTISRNELVIPMDTKSNIVIDKSGHARLTDFGLTTSNGVTATKEADVSMFATVAAEVCTGEGESYESF